MTPFCTSLDIWPKILKIVLNTMIAKSIDMCIVSITTSIRTIKKKIVFGILWWGNVAYTR